MKLAAVFLLGFLLRAAIILTNPIVWGGDTIIRLFDRHTLLKSYQLPLLQVLISGVSSISMNPIVVQFLMAAIGAVAGVGFYLLAADFVDEKFAFPAALLFVTHPYILAVSTVPFQEILMLAALFFGFHFFYTGRWIAASLCLGAACLTRYEAWAACPVLAVACWLRTRSIVRAAVFGWAPVAWIAFRHGLAPTGHFVLERSISLVRFQRYAYIGWITLKFTPVPTLLLAVLGAWVLWRSRAKLDWRWGVQIAFLAVFLMSLLFSAHGVAPDPERYVTSREAHIPMYMVLLLAAVGISWWPRVGNAAVVLSVAVGIFGAFRYAQSEASKPEIQTDYRVARYLDQNVTAGERVLIEAPPLSADMTRDYLEKARATGGEESYRVAARELAEIASTPPDYQRIVVYSRLAREQLLSRADGCADWVVRWNAAGSADPVTFSHQPCSKSIPAR
jgi:hypothetical protein